MAATGHHLMAADTLAPGATARFEFAGQGGYIASILVVESTQVATGGGASFQLEMSAGVEYQVEVREGSGTRGSYSLSTAVYRADC